MSSQANPLSMQDPYAAFGGAAITAQQPKAADPYATFGGSIITSSAAPMTPQGGPSPDATTLARNQAAAAGEEERLKYMSQMPWYENAAPLHAELQGAWENLKGVGSAVSGTAKQAFDLWKAGVAGDYGPAFQDVKQQVKPMVAEVMQHPEEGLAAPVMGMIRPMIEGAKKNPQRALGQLEGMALVGKVADIPTEGTDAISPSISKVLRSKAEYLKDADLVRNAGYQSASAKIMDTLRNMRKSAGGAFERIGDLDEARSGLEGKAGSIPTRDIFPGIQSAQEVYNAAGRVSTAVNKIINEAEQFGGTNISWRTAQALKSDIGDAADMVTDAKQRAVLTDTLDSLDKKLAERAGELGVKKLYQNAKGVYATAKNYAENPDSPIHKLLVSPNSGSFFRVLGDPDNSATLRQAEADLGQYGLSKGWFDKLAKNYELVHRYIESSGQTGIAGIFRNVYRRPLVGGLGYLGGREAAMELHAPTFFGGLLSASGAATIADKIAIANKLAELGVPEVVPRIPFISSDSIDSAAPAPKPPKPPTSGGATIGEQLAAKGQPIPMPSAEPISPAEKADLEQAAGRPLTDAQARQLILRQRTNAAVADMLAGRRYSIEPGAEQMQGGLEPGESIEIGEPHENMSGGNAVSLESKGAEAAGQKARMVDARTGKVLHPLNLHEVRAGEVHPSPGKAIELYDPTTKRWYRY